MNRFLISAALQGLAPDLFQVVHASCRVLGSRPVISQHAVISRGVRILLFVPQGQFTVKLAALGMEEQIVSNFLRDNMLKNIR
ncbi:hypothetical protein D1872_219070 [compost metagenome]